METRELRSRGISWRAIRTSNAGVPGAAVKNLSQLTFAGLWPATHRFGLIRKVDLLALAGQRIRLHGYPIDFSVMEAVQDELSVALQSSGYPNFLRPTENRDTIAVHWRLGDYVNNHFHGVVTACSLVQGLDLLHPDWKAQGLEIYTDSPNLLRNKRIGSMLANPKIISGDIWNDLYRMSSAGYFLGNHSGISQWAALSILARKDAARVVLPFNWFRPEVSDVEVLPTDAMRLRMIWKPELAMGL